MRGVCAQRKRAVLHRLEPSNKDHRFVDDQLEDSPNLLSLQSTILR